MKSIIVLLVTSVAMAVAMQPGFDPKDVVSQVRGAQFAGPAESFDSGESLIGKNRIIGPAFGIQYYPAVSSDGTNFLVVWQDGENGPDNIYGVRVTTAGVVLDRAGIAISTAPDYQYSPAVTFDGANFLVVWRDTRNGPLSDIYGARLSRAGTVLDPNGIPISIAEDTQWDPAVASDGTNSLVVWEDSRSDTGICAARVSQAGTVLDPNGIPISTAADWQEYPAVSFDGANFLVVWQRDRSGGSEWDVCGARVTPQGTVLDSAGVAISQAAKDQCFPVLGFDGANFLVVWQDHRSDFYGDIYGARVTPQGTVLDTGGIAVSQAAHGQCSPALAFDGANSLVAWQDERNGYADVYGTRVSRAGTVLDPNGISISTAANEQVAPAVSFDGTNFLVVWQDERNGWWDTYGARVSQPGIVLDPTGIAISTGTAVHETPDVLRFRPDATFICGALFLPQHTACLLMDAAGRKVADLVPGANDVSRLAPGIYFLCTSSPLAGNGRGETALSRKLIFTH